MELKSDYLSDELPQAYTGFNRTFMELKFRSGKREDPYLTF